MRDQEQRGNVIIEFCLVMAFFLLPMLLFTYAIGFNLLQELQVIQLARDAGHLYVTLNYGQQVHLDQEPFKTILGQIGGTAGYPTTAGVIFAKFQYVDQATCGLGGGTGSPPSCANSGKWVYVQYYTPAGQTLPGTFHSALGTAPSGGSGPYAHGAKDTQGDFNLSDAVTAPGLLASTGDTLLGVQSYHPDSNPGLPSGQTIFYVEVAATPFNVTGVTSLTAISDHAVF